MTNRAVIRDEALRLFADRGPDAVTVRQIAAAAEVSPALIVHHFGSKSGLQEAVDQHVLAIADAVLNEMVAAHARDPFGQAASVSIAGAIVAHLSDTPVPAYLRRLLLVGNNTGRDLFRRLYQLSAGTLETLAAAGLAAPGADPQVRAALLMSNDLAVLLLRDHLADAIGVDPLSAPGIARWTRELLAIYGSGLAAQPPGDLP